MVFFIFILLLMFSLCGVLYLMVRALPRVADADVAQLEGSETGTGASRTGNRILDRWAHSRIPERIDLAFNDWFLKFLRRFKVFTLKMDNAISKRLHKINRDSAAAEKKAAIDFKEIAAKSDEKK